MPNRQIVNGEPYRYGYQGEFAETDPETGKPAFQLRIYDPRINRWLSPDPYGQYHSPYMAMGNNWMNGVDKDGGCWDSEGNPCPDGAIGDTMVGAQGATWTFGENGWNTDAFDSNEAFIGTLFNYRNERYLGQTQYWAFANNTMGEVADKRADAHERLVKSNRVLMMGAQTVIGMAGEAQTLTNGLRGNKKFNPDFGPKRAIPNIPAVLDASGGVVVRRGATNAGSPRVVIQKGNRTYDITVDRVKEHVKNHRNPNARYGDAVNFKKYGVPKGSEIIKGAGKGHKRTPTKAELDLLYGN